MPFAFNTFAGSSPPWSLQALDNNFAALVNGGAALNVNSVTTPAVLSGGTANLIIGGGGGNWTFNGTSGDLTPTSGQDNVFSLGTAALRIKQAFTPIIDSGTTGSLSLRTNGGTTGFRVDDVASGVNLIAVRSAATTGDPAIYAAGSDPNPRFNLGSQGTGSFQFFTTFSTTPVVQFEVSHTASVTRHPVVTGSNGGNVQWGSSAGGSDFTSATIRFPNIGTTANAANATLNAVGSNDLLRSTSSLRYKKLLGELSLNDARRIVCGARAIVFQPIEGGRDHIGLAAEWMAEIDERVITRDEKGRPDWVQYPHLTAPLMLVVQDIEQRLKVLESR